MQPGDRCRTDCVERPVSVGFQKLGVLIARHPYWFLLIPVLLSAALGAGFSLLRSRETYDMEDQFTPVSGPAKLERQIVQLHFPKNASSFSALRLTTDGTFSSVIISVSQVSSILSPNAWTEVRRLDEKIRKLSIESGDRRVSYENLCAQESQKCISNGILDLIGETSEWGDAPKLPFPFAMLHSRPVFLGSQVGGVQVKSGLIETAQAVRLHYFLREDNLTLSHMWLKAFTALLADPSSLNLSEVSVSHFTSLSRQEELKASSKSVIPFFSVTYTLAITFSILSCLRLDNVRNKIWAAVFGVLGTGLAVLSSFGLLLFVGVPFAMTVASSPFLILGIGVDDMFIMISCWQRTNVHEPVEQRMADTYKEAAVSITITTLTDVLAFYIGTMTAFRSVQSFCLYTGTAVLFCYFYNITFFGAFLALNGRREKSNRHWLTCMKIPKESQPDHSFAYRMCCVGGAYDKNTNSEEVMPVNNFFKNHYGPFLTKPLSKVLVVIIYVAYLASSIYGCLQVKEGIDLRNLASDDSYIVKYYLDEKSYFTNYGPNVMVVVNNEFPYWNKNQLKTLQLCTQDLKNLSFVDKDISMSWLEAYENYGEKSKINLLNEDTFKKYLPTFLQNSGFSQDVNFTNGTIYASRFFIQTRNISSAVDEKNLLNELRGTANRCPVPLLVYHPAFIYYDQYAVIVSNTIQNIVVATAVMLLISLLLIPNPLCSLWVTFAIGSVIVGVTGFMALWGVNLDSISMINLVICIGFSVDFSAHISYAYVSSKEPTANKKAVEALHSLGYPILQGAASTILGVVVLSASKGYIFRTFFKIMFLVILLGMLHGIVFIPVFLTLMGSYTKPLKKKTQCEDVL